MSEAAVWRETESEVIDPEPQRALAVVDEGISATGVLALAALPEEEFDRRLRALETGRDRVERIQKALMTKDVDYGVIPGTPKPTLYKSGAEILCLAYSLAADFVAKRTIGDNITSPALSYLMRCELHLGSLNGPVVAVGHGAANSWETKHRYRRGERICPNCGKPAIIKGKQEYGGGWVCFKKKDGCGAKWRDGDQVIEGQSVADVENADPFDLDVVLAKMAEKRSHVDATLRATNASRLFTQDIEDLARPEPAPIVDRETGEVTGHAVDGLIGTVAVQGTQDFNLRETPTGWALPFRVKDGRQSVICVAHDALAQDLSLMTELVGKRVQVWGRYTKEPLPNKPGITFNVLHLTKITGEGWTLPDEPKPVAPAHPPADDLASFEALMP